VRYVHASETEEEEKKSSEMPLEDLIEEETPQQESLRRDEPGDLRRKSYKRKED